VRGACFAGWTGVASAVPVASDCTCFFDAVLVSLTANSAKAAITIVQATIPPKPTNLTIAAYT
jgi:hypothetical protein